MTEIMKTEQKLQKKRWGNAPFRKKKQHTHTHTRKKNPFRPFRVSKNQSCIKGNTAFPMTNTTVSMIFSDISRHAPYSQNIC